MKVSNLCAVKTYSSLSPIDRPEGQCYKDTKHLDPFPFRAHEHQVPHLTTPNNSSRIILAEFPKATLDIERSRVLKYTEVKASYHYMMDACHYKET